MPTKKQLNISMESDLEFGYPNVRGSEHNAIGESPSPPPRLSGPENGEVLGWYSWDAENQCMKFTVNPDL